MSIKNLFSSKKILFINIALACLIIGFFIGIVTLSCSTKISSNGIAFAQDESKSLDGIQALESIQYSFRKVAEKVLPVVVEISIVDIVTQDSPGFDSPWDFFFGPENKD